MTTDWPVRLVDRDVTLRPLAVSDHDAWRRARQRNAAWLVPWDATVPPGGEARPTSFKQLVRRLSRQARRGQTYPFAVEVDGRFAGQVTVNNIVRGSAQFASVGYWLDKDFAGRGVMPRAAQASSSPFRPLVVAASISRPVTPRMRSRVSTLPRDSEG